MDVCSVSSTNEMLLHSLVFIAICWLYYQGMKAVTWFKREQFSDDSLDDV